jgi:glycosyltransferase involved in cell wall biosynthesis
MKSFSIVIVCKNETDIIGSTLQSLVDLTDDIIVYDTGSTDGTQEKIRQYNVRLFEGDWEGYGNTKNKATQYAKYDWILSLDADETIDEPLRQSLWQCEPGSETIVYDLKRRNYYRNKYLKHGHWGRDHLIRFFNRRTVKWNDDAVHEKLLFPADVRIKKLKGFILHRSIKDLRDYSNKMVDYAMLGAEKYFKLGKKATWIKLYLSPGFTFFNHYILKLGFLDGYPGYLTAMMTSWYTFLKYARLKELWEKKVSAQNPNFGS